MKRSTVKNRTGFLDSLAWGRASEKGFPVTRTVWNLNEITERLREEKRGLFLDCPVNPGNA